MDENMNLTEKNISIKTTNGTVVNVTCSYAEDKRNSGCPMMQRRLVSHL